MIKRTKKITFKLQTANCKSYIWKKFDTTKHLNCAKIVQIDFFKFLHILYNSLIFS